MERWQRMRSKDLRKQQWLTTVSGGRCEMGTIPSCLPASAAAFPQPHSWHWTFMAHESTVWSFPCLAPSLPWNFNYPRRNYITIRNYDTFRLLTPLSAYISANAKIMIRYWNCKNEFEALAAVLCSVPCQTPVTARFLYLHKSAAWADHCNPSLCCIQCSWLNIEVLFHWQDKLPQALNRSDILNTMYLYCFTMNKRNPDFFSNWHNQCPFKSPLNV